MSVTTLVAATNLAIALGCGALIGVERQLRRRKAGLRTNALVALGSAAFMIFSMQIEGDMSPSRVAAQVVSGIGFLGAGIIFRDGLTVHGLTTAATLWCAAAVGLLAGAGEWRLALVATGMVVFVNLGLRPFVQWLKKRLNARETGGRAIRITLGAATGAGPMARATLLRILPLAGLRLTAIEEGPARGEGGGIELTADVTGESESVTDEAIEQAILHLAAEPVFTALRWRALDEE